ncbi:MAG: caspase family protein [Burkholderiales bacterium]|nr:caspase family protein [Burkholderiales bacterium]
MPGYSFAAGKRVALLIGNNNYGTAPLVNAVNDARDLAEALNELGFKTIVKENTTRQDMAVALRDFARELDGAEAALFFYAGHAMQFKDRNFLIPVDADMKTEEDVTFSSVELSQVFDRMERARTRFNFIVLDACRDNPFATAFKVSASGLAQIANAPSGTLVAYATAPGSVAADGYGRNGVYTKHILQQIKVPDLPVEIMFKRVREAVERETRRLQTPWDVSSLKGDFAFNGSGAGTRAAAAPAGGPSSDAQLAIEREFWVSVRDSNRAEDIQAYLDKYPQGQYAILAKSRIEAIVRPGRRPATQQDVAAAPAESVATAPAPAATAAPATAAVTAPAATTPATQVAAAATSPRPAQTQPGTAPKSVPKPEPATAETVTPAASPAARPAETAAVSTPAPQTETAKIAAVPATTLPGTTLPAAPPPVSAAPVPAAATPARPPVDLTPGREIAPGVREVTYDDGSIYRGGLRGTRLHGSGEYESKALGFKYRGEYQDGNMHGKGNLTFASGDNYEGEFADNRPHGKGVYKFANGDSYVGEMKAGVISGRGLFTTKAGDTIDGNFVDAKATGKGVYKFVSGDRYEGEMVQGKLTGKGTYFAANGDRIEGDFVDGKPVGGIYHFTNGDRYQGEMQNGTLTGRGVYFHKNGAKYEGEMVAGKPQGKGTFWFGDGNARFEGVFEDGMKRAKGVYIDKDGKKSDAEMVDSEIKFIKG